MIYRLIISAKLVGRLKLIGYKPKQITYKYNQFISYSFQIAARRQRQDKSVGNRFEQHLC
ncbi:hypothetical protein BSQ97_20560 [Serratia proteamaculans]|nr:hypothetical protein BSQ97_20560 [Serratia proteamaculans]